MSDWSETRNYLEIVFEHFGEIILQFGAAEVLQDLLPVRRVLKYTNGGYSYFCQIIFSTGVYVESAKVWLEFACEDFERRRLANAVGADQSKDLTGTGHGKTMKFERVGRVAVCDGGGQVLGQIDDGDGLKGTLFHTDATSNAQFFRDPCQLHSMYV